MKSNETKFLLFHFTFLVFCFQSGNVTNEWWKKNEVTQLFVTIETTQPSLRVSHNAFENAQPCSGISAKQKFISVTWWQNLHLLAGIMIAFELTILPKTSYLQVDRLLRYLQNTCFMHACAAWLQDSVYEWSPQLLISYANLLTFFFLFKLDREVFHVKNEKLY